MATDPEAGARSSAGAAEPMAAALEAARQGWGRTAPNPMVGAVVVREGHPLAIGWHAEFGGAHAEIMALARAGDAARGATMHVTLEPCAHEGKTPPCADALIRAGIARVVIATRDPNSVARGGLERLRDAGIIVDRGPLALEACELNAPYFFSYAAARPWVMLKLALSADGGIADAAGRSKWITGREARAEGHRLRAGSDAVAVGIGTALADDPALTVRDAPPPRVPPVRVVFDRHARLPVRSQLARSAREVPVIVIAKEPEPARVRALEGTGVEVIAAASLEAALERLKARGVRALLVEGGAALAGAFLERALVDRLVIFRAPASLGAGALRPFERSPSLQLGAAGGPRIVEQRAFGEDTQTIFALQELPCSPD